MEFHKILVAVKGDRADEAAIKLACHLAQENKGEVYAIYVIEVPRSLPLEALLDEEVERGEAILRRAQGIAEEMDYQVETEIVKAREAGPAIVDLAMEKEVDLILLGMEYKTRFGEFHLGHTVPYILKRAPCRVFLTREAVLEKP